MTSTVGILIGLLMLVGNAFFVGAEFAIMTARSSQLETLASERRRGAGTALWAVEHISLMLAAAQLGVTVCSVSLGAVAEPAIAQLIQPLLDAMHVSTSLAHPIAFALALLIASYLHVVFGEMIPKNISIAVPVRAVLILAPPLVLFAKVLHPIIWVLNGLANSVLRMLRVEPRSEVSAELTADQIAAIVDESRREGLVHDEQGLLSGAIHFSDQHAGDVMVPISDVLTVNYATTPEKLESLIARTGFSRIGVTNGVGDLIGYLHVSDVVIAGIDEAAYHSSIDPAIVRAFVTVTENQPVKEVLAAMQHNGAHWARVDSVRSRNVGVVFLEDILEQLVGEVNDIMQADHNFQHR